MLFLISVFTWICLFLQPVFGRQPHIIFILADDYGFNDIGYHNQAILTPNLDYLAAHGVKLENYYVQPICTPTRSSLMSGKYPIHSGLQHGVIFPPQPNCLPITDPTLADKLKEAGYVTHAVGKWHLGFYKKACWPTRRGFDSFLGFFNGQGGYFTHRKIFRMPGLVNDVFDGLDMRENETATHDYEAQYSTMVYASKAVDIIRTHNPDKPLFLYLPFQAVHTPLTVPRKYLQPYKHLDNHRRKVYAGMTTCMDEAVGSVTQAIIDAGLWHDTLIIFSTDNGGNPTNGGNNYPLRGRKNSLWEGGIRGVGFLSGGAIPTLVQGTISHELIHVSDWFPTLVIGVAGGQTNGTNLDGVNQWPTISQMSTSARTELLHNIDPLFHSDGFTDDDYVMPTLFNNTMHAAIRIGDWKLLTGDQGDGSWIAPPETGLRSVHPEKSEGKRVWLFNIRDDPYEMYDVSDERPDIVTSMMERLEYYYNSSIPVRFPAFDMKSNPAYFHDTWDSWED